MDVRDNSTEYDPFEAFNRAMGAGMVQDPYPEFLAMRRQGPLYPADIRSLMGLETDADLSRWVDAGAEHAASLPPK